MLGHELTHIRNGDVRMMVIAVIIAGAIGFFAELLFRMLFSTRHLAFGGGRSSRDERPRQGRQRGRDRRSRSRSMAVAWLLSVVIRFALSREREYLADAGSVELTKNPDAMISALRKIEGRGELQGATSAVMEMCVDNPRSEFADVFDTHPSVEKRIAALIQFAGGHDPGPLALEPAEAPAEQPPAEGPWSTTTGASDEFAGGATASAAARRPAIPARPAARSSAAIGRRGPPTPAKAGRGARTSNVRVGSGGNGRRRARR